MGLFLVGYIFSLLILAISGGFSTNAAVRITKIPNYKENKKLKSAHSLLTIAAVLTWISVAITLTLIILDLIFGADVGGGFLLFIFMGILLIVTIIVGILSAIAANDIRTSGTKDNKGSETAAIVGASLALGVIGLVIILFIVKIVIDNKSSKTKEEKQQKRQQLLDQLSSGSDTGSEGGAGGFFKGLFGKGEEAAEDVEGEGGEGAELGAELLE